MKAPQILLLLVAAEIISTIAILGARLFEYIPSLAVARLDTALETFYSSEMDLLYLVLLAFYIAIVLVVRKIEDQSFSKKARRSLLTLCIALYCVLLLFQRVGGDVQRSLTFAAMFTRGFDPYRFTGAEMNARINELSLNFPLVQSYLSQPFSYPSLTLLAYATAVIISPSPVLWATSWQILITIVRLAGGYAVWKAAGQLELQRTPLTLLFLLNPMLLYTAHDGKEDVLMISAALASAYYVLSHKSGRSGIVLAASVASKFVTATFLPGFAILAGSLKQRLRFTAGFCAALALSSLPLVFHSPYVLTFIAWQLARPCNSPLNLTCYNYGPTWVWLATVLLASAWLSATWVIMKPESKNDYAWLLTLTLVSLTIFLGRSFFLWYLDWFTPALYFLAKPKLSLVLVPHALILVAVPSMLLR